MINAKRIAKFKACSADDVRTEFGVGHGTPLRHIEDFVNGDVYLAKRDINWLSVCSADDLNSDFTLSMAANLPDETLTTLAQFVFMTTTGRRFDMFAASCNGELFLVAEDMLQQGQEYVLIDVIERDVDFVPRAVPAAPAPALPAAATPNVTALRLFG